MMQKCISRVHVRTPFLRFATEQATEKAKLPFFMQRAQDGKPTVMICFVILCAKQQRLSKQ